MIHPPRLLSIEGSGLGSFLEPFKIKLPKSGLVLLRGKNCDTGGSSGSGKSTLIHAINYPLGMCDVPSTELQHWGSDEFPTVAATYFVGGKTVRVHRGKKLMIQEAEQKPFEGSAKQKEEKLVEMFGMDTDMLRTLTYRGQRKPGLFLTKTDSEKKEFLTKLLQLDKFEAEQERSAAKVKDLEGQLQVLLARKTDFAARQEQIGVGDKTKCLQQLEEARAALSRRQQSVVEVEQKIREKRDESQRAYDAELLAHKSEVEVVTKRLLALKQETLPERPTTSPVLEKAVAMKDESDKRLRRVKEEDAERNRLRNYRVAELNETVRKLWAKARSVDGWLAKKSTIEQTLESLAKNVCPTCSREWADSEAKKEELREDLVRIQAEVDECALVQTKINELQQELDDIPPFMPDPKIQVMQDMVYRARAAVTAEEEHLKSEYEQATAGHNGLVAEAQAEAATLREKVRLAAEARRTSVLANIVGLEAILAQARSGLPSLQKDVDAFSYEMGRVVEQERQWSAMQQHLFEVEKQLEPIQAKLSEERDFAQLIGREGFLGSIFDEVLEEISSETNDVLASISNTRHCTLHFASESLTQKGSVRREIVPLVTINGHRASLKFGPSGGMLSAIELAVDLAVGAVISRRTGVVPGWLILDESFDGRGPVEKETCLEILQKYAADRLVLVVDHMTETQGLFTHRINVEFSGGRSTIVVG